MRDDDVPRRNTERSADRKLVASTIELIASHERASTAGQRAIGERVLDDYFGGDVTAAQSKDPYKPKSFAMLVAQAARKVDWSDDDFRRAVKTAIAWRSLPARVRKSLTARQLFRLSSIDDIAERRRVAARIAAGDLTAKQADALVTKAGAAERRGGRAPTPPAVRIVRDVERAVADVRRGRALRAGLDAGARRDLAKRLLAAAAALTALAAQID